jgi:hypothetical protein
MHSLEHCVLMLSVAIQYHEIGSAEASRKLREIASRSHFDYVPSTEASPLDVMSGELSARFGHLVNEYDPSRQT